MHTDWLSYLESRGAHIAEGRVADFGAPSRELEASRDGTVIADLSRYGLLRVTGDDAQPFLHGQLSSDVRALTPRQAQHSSYNTAKGRMLTTFLLWQRSEGYDLQLAAELTEPIRQRLSLFILRAKVRIEDASDACVRLGVSGPGARRLLAPVFGRLPEAELEVVHTGDATLIGLDAQRFELVTLPDQAAALWESLERHVQPVGTPCWEWLQIRAGIPLITPATQDQFVPQMANLDAIGGISFRKGCYPGQEIVARTHYLGKVKRRLYRVHLDGSAAPAPGDELYSPDAGEQSSGVVVNAAPAPGGGYDALAVIQVASAEAGEVHWKTPDGPRLEFLPLPYQVPR
ncbi:MAG: folate-binding protein [Azospira oryzae]|uniref:Folate-binding protein YgfZ n=1 Tax=Pelomicrobium methylotrophicum TaxID=2602750 RepID=A0A5C7ELH6_9PROT|nr:folate-binding protein YgfZ [Pelomicrobium methylotrophicum]PZP58123.1 MAG: folate-binding protein [Azospira oryzae]PZP79627.1 MAG: folate-binding protein [Azospira oryzae]TXF13574.1 folate-binding protein YgfZ [Pelomicrobium methylotrophicum]